MNTQVIYNLAKLGFTYDDAVALRRISMTLHRWHELECGDGNDYASWSIERDETTGKPYHVTYPHDGKPHRTRIADREQGAIKRLNAIVGRYPGFSAYVQTDPRGASLYILRPDDVPAGASVESCYSNGVAVYK